MIVRSGLPVGVLLIASLLAAPSVFAADKFYQIIGADGRPQTVLVPEPKESAPDARAQDTDSKSTADEKAAESTPNALDKKNLTESAKKTATPSVWRRLFKSVPSESAQTPLSEAPKTPSNPPTGWAPYDSETYLDSEVIDTTNFNPEQRKRFYLLNDGTRVRTEEELAPASTDSFSQAEPKKAAPLRNVQPLADEYKEQVAATTLPNLLKDGCLSEAPLKAAQPLKDSMLTGVVIDKTTLAFVKPGEVIAGFDLGWHQGGRLFIHSYARTARKPSFVKPLVLITDERGCVTRLLSGYFQQRYSATKTRYSELEGEIRLQPEETYIFLVLPAELLSDVHSHYTVSRIGKLGIKWVR